MAIFLLAMAILLIGSVYFSAMTRHTMMPMVKAKIMLRILLIWLRFCRRR
ncbi:MAG: hypothetical protein A4E60_03028 [Syntrophorhabdus sp. PtaB.Bin047]|nr:MAG: hypothetical protein A4E60_03028 [Syntrophorhabdus sp. PtaB.Bin047]